MAQSCDILEKKDEEDPSATVRIKNDFNNPEIDRKPPWTMCECSYQDVEFGKVLIGDSSKAKDVEPGLDYVLMVLAWNDTSCSLHNCLPVASKNEEETVDGQTRTISINAPNHQGPCPPEGIQPMPESLYERIRSKWPEYDFEPYDEREQNPQCLD
ncbi:MAG: hypothetical protein GF418_13640 [Chitinivibrionales bacterium]|nr:hypothetical protein [Chitinivibrionales bacterium]MBD3396663.1 hypothetical protein [Chitinivibrionales bacterium]